MLFSVLLLAKAIFSVQLMAQLIKPSAAAAAVDAALATGVVLVVSNAVPLTAVKAGYPLGRDLRITGRSRTLGRYLLARGLGRKLPVLWAFAIGVCTLTGLAFHGL